MPEMIEISRFVILAAPRSGSNLLCTLLNSHPEILCHHEVYNAAGMFYALEYRNGSFDLGTMEERDRAPLAYLERLWSADFGHRFVGFKMTGLQNEVVLEHVIGNPAIRKIVLHRRNRIKTFVSTLVAEKLDQWEVYNVADLCEPRPQVSLNVDDLQAHIALNEAYYARIGQALQLSGQEGVEIAYEDLASPVEHARLLTRLGVARHSIPLIAKSVKQNPTDLRQVVTNYEQLLNALQGTDLVDELRSSRN